ncbi:MAG: helicase-related protein, partial [Sulfobacillus sp.]
KEHLVEVEKPLDGFLFSMPAVGLKEQRAERRISLGDRCEAVAKTINGRSDQSLVWCHMNDEGDLLEELIPDAVQISGSDSDTAKEERFLAFAEGRIRVLVTKPKIGAWGLNFQNCQHVTFFPSHSFEQYYQAVRRCWRFGQKKSVLVDIFTTEGERGVLKNLQRKAAQADQMFDHLVAEMNNALGIDRANTMTKKVEVPSWLS